MSRPRTIILCSLLALATPLLLPAEDAMPGPNLARRDALLAIGGLELRKEECRDTRGVRFAEDLVRDLSYALRSLRRAPAFTIASVLTLTLGIGATVAMFTVVNGVLLRPMPFPEADRLYLVALSKRSRHPIRRASLRLPRTVCTVPTRKTTWPTTTSCIAPMLPSGPRRSARPSQRSRRHSSRRGSCPMVSSASGTSLHSRA
jgi:hypothetical protein